MEIAHRLTTSVTPDVGNVKIFITTRVRKIVSGSYEIEGPHSSEEVVNSSNGEIIVGTLIVTGRELQRNITTS